MHCSFPCPLFASQNGRFEADLRFKSVQFLNFSWRDLCTLRRSSDSEYTDIPLPINPFGATIDITAPTTLLESFITVDSKCLPNKAQQLLK